MGKRRARPASQSSSDAPSAKKPQSNRPPGPRTPIPWWRKLLYGLFVTAGVFAVAELGLALAGWKPLLHEEDPYLGFSSHVPLFVEETSPDGQVSLRTARNKRSWFNEQRFRRQKPADAYRIFCLGGSTTYGRPYDDETSFAGWLRELLREVEPSRNWEVINTGGISYASYRVVKVMEELAAYSPDLFIVYSGHNEFLEARTYNDLSETPEIVTSLASLFGRTRIYAALARLVVRNPPARPTDAADKQLLPSEVKTLLDSAVGPDVYHRDDTLHRQIAAHYAFNLRRMAELARQAGAEIIFVTPSSNLADCSPFKSEHDSDVQGQRLATWNSLVAEAQSYFESNQLEAARRAIDQAVEVDQRHAGAWFLRGRILAALGEQEAARTAFLRARDEDICTLRAPTEFLRTVRTVAKEEGAACVDFDLRLRTIAPDGVPGESLFLDHVHPTIEANRELALMLLATMREMGIIKSNADWGEEQIAAVTQRVMSRVDTEKQATALRNLSKVLSWAGKGAEVDHLALRAAELLPNDAEAQYQAGNAYMRRGDVEAALARYGRSLELEPHSAATRYSLGLAHSQQGNDEAAKSHYLMAVEIDPRFGDAHYNLGMLLDRLGDQQAAALHYQQAIASNPRDFDAHNNLGILHAKQGQWSQARSYFEQALRLNPNAVGARLNLGRLLVQVGEPQAAREQFGWVLARFPDHPEARAELAKLQ